MNDELDIDVIGALGIALDPEAPTKLVNDQVLAKFGTPAWLLGLDGGAGGPAERQSEMVLQASRTRFELRKPGLTHLVATMLRLRGRTWSPGDWELEQELPSLQDMMKIAQANFLNAQAAMVGQGNNTPAPKGIDNNLRHARQPGRRKAGGAKAASDDEEGEPWAQDGEALSRIERAGIRGQLALWRTLAADALELIGFSLLRGHVQPHDPAADAWTFDHGQAAALAALGDRFVERSVGDDAPIPNAVSDAFDRGLVNAAAELGLSVEDAIAEQFAQVRDQLRSRGGELIRSATGRAYRDRVIGELTSGAYDGMNPVAVAKLLEDKFDAGDYDWERLTRSEMAIAQSRGKVEQFKANGTELYDYTTAGDDRVSEICLELAAQGPYPVGGAGSPIPVVDSHPNCRCSITPHVE
jgi:SPP1 gp7 family putative phage head morphogenesis protein